MLSLCVCRINSISAVFLALFGATPTEKSTKNHLYDRVIKHALLKRHSTLKKTPIPSIFLQLPFHADEVMFGSGVQKADSTSFLAVL